MLPKDKHVQTNHKLELEMFGELSTRTIEGAFSLFKRGVIGSYHHLSKDHPRQLFAGVLLAVQSPQAARADVRDVDAGVGYEETADLQDAYSGSVLGRRPAATWARTMHSAQYAASFSENQTEIPFAMQSLSWADASLLLEKYLGTPVKAVLASTETGVFARLTGVLGIEEIQGEKWLGVVDGNNRLALSFASCIFIYSDPRDAKDGYKEAANREAEGMLAIINTELRVSLSIFEI